ncbi:uncharacterized protein RJT20DRAFT_116732 [Scheffersomyces xylosifermentans]|uniref:uncharacterized protein n=1 Tax=Scheffersomyces xylosifermentans TaxID=1304137 RepID=UPI00315CBDEA
MSSVIRIFQFIVILSLLRSTCAAFVETQGCNLVENGFLLAPFVIDAALDEEHQKLKFFINSKVTSINNISSTDIMIADVNYTTNRYTTFHVEIDFMGRTFINENRRFCDIISVKNTTDYRNGPRFPRPVSSQIESGPTDSPDFIPASDKFNETINARRHLFYEDDEEEERIGNFDEEEDDLQELRKNNGIHHPNKLQSAFVVASNESDYFASDNTTIQQIFSNSTGQLVQCPLYVNDSIAIYYEADISQHFHRLGSYSVRFSVISNKQGSSVIGCSKAYVTPVQPDSVSGVLLLGILIFLVVVALLNILIIVYSSFQESSNPFLFKASTICNEQLLKQLDATVPGIILYLQFALFIGGLDLQYPGFYQPLIGQIRWCALLGVPIVNRSAARHVTRSDNIYVTMNTGGLKSLTLLTTDKSIIENWPNFILCFLIVVSIVIVLQEIFLVIKIFLSRLMRHSKLRDKLKLYETPVHEPQFHFTFRKNLYFILGQILDAFMIIFGLPFLILTSFMFASAGDINNKSKQYPSHKQLTKDAFSNSTSYEQLFVSPAYDKTMFTDTQINATVFDGSFASNYTNATITGHMKSGSVSSVSIVMGSILFTVWIGLAIYFVVNYLIWFRNFKLVRNKKTSRLYTSIKTILLWSFFYNHYHPNKVYYVIFDLWSLLSKSLVIGLLQEHGSIQVTCLIILEFLDLAFLFSIRPYFVKITWKSSKWLLPVARFLVTVLCIPYIKPLQLSEASRTYVAYVQLIMHLVVAIIFLMQLFYSFGKMVISIIKRRHESKQLKKLVMQERVDSLDNFNREFEYQPNSVPVEDNMDTLASSPYSPSKVKPLDDLSLGDEEDDEKFYYRARNEEQLEKIFNERYHISEKVKLNRELSDKTLLNKVTEPAQLAEIESTSEDQSLLVSESDMQSFTKQQHFSDMRKELNDYSVREGDQIYKKYFVDDSIDPEVKALWDSRPNWGPTKKSESTATGAQSQQSTERVGMLLKRARMATSKLFGKKKEPVASAEGFQVLRPRQLVVKKLEDIESVSRNSTSVSSESGSSSPMFSARSEMAMDSE